MDEIKNFQCKNMSISENFDVDDPRYRITPTQQMLCASVGALATSVLGK